MVAFQLYNQIICRKIRHLGFFVRIGQFRREEERKCSTLQNLPLHRRLAKIDHSSLLGVLGKGLVYSGDERGRVTCALIILPLQQDNIGKMIKGGVHCLDVIRCGFNFITAMIGFAQEGVFRPRGDDGTFDGWELE